MILTVTLNPSVDRLLIVERARLGDTNRVLRTETDAGGKGVNLSRVAHAMGASTLASGFLGGGPGAFVKSVLERESVPNDFVEIAGDTRMNISVENDDGSMPPTMFNERGPEISKDKWEELRQKIYGHVKDSRYLCVGGSVPPGLGPEAFKALGAIANESKVRFVLDADGDPLRSGLAAKPFLVKPNSREAERLLIRPVRTKTQCLEAARELHQQGVQIVVISRGAAGAVMVCPEGDFDGISPVVKTRSTIGSGDSMVGAMLWALEEGKSMVEAFAWGLAAGAATAATSGSEIAKKPAIEHLLPQVTILRQREA